MVSPCPDGSRTLSSVPERNTIVFVSLSLGLTQQLARVLVISHWAALHRVGQRGRWAGTPPVGVCSLHETLP